MSVLELKNVSFKYNNSDEWILKDVSISVKAGEITLLTGESGSGKSTLLSIIAGIIPEVTGGVLEGDVLVNGESIIGKGMSSICRKVGIVLQNADSQIIHSIVEDEIAFGCENFAFSPEMIREKIDIACDKMKLGKDWECRKLSGGQKQRLITACTLATGQKLLIFDEPLANLDAEGTEILMRTLRGLAGDGYSVIIVEHRTDRVKKYADRILQIKDGGIEECNALPEDTEIEDESAGIAVQPDDIFVLDNVSYTVPGSQILKDISLTVQKGERLLLIGENGCGKTTMLRLLARLIRPSAGVIRQNLDPAFDRRRKGSAKWFRKVGVVYQNPDYQLFMDTVRGEIEFGAYDNGYADHIIELFGLENIAGRHPQSLSEGQKRRVTIAAVLASRPQVLLLDEPTVGQDYKRLESMIHILNDIHREIGNTLITVTHDKRCAKALCDRAFLFSENGAVLPISRDSVSGYLQKEL